MSRNRKLMKAVAEQVKHDLDAQQAVKMKFNEDKFYSDLTVPHFEKGKVYEIKGADQIQRWLKRGGEIVQGGLDIPPQEINNSAIVDNNTPPSEGDVSQDK